LGIFLDLLKTALNQILLIVLQPFGDPN
jgi:hypothetical protein